MKKYLSSMCLVFLDAPYLVAIDFPAAESVNIVIVTLGAMFTSLRKFRRQ